MNVRSSHPYAALPLVAAALFAQPGAAQQVAPPPVVATQGTPPSEPATPTVSPPPVVSTATPSTPVATTVAEPPAAATPRAERRPLQRAARTAPAPRAVEAPRPAAAPAVPVAPAAVTPSPAAEAPAAPVAAAAPAAPAAPAARERDGSIWPWLVAALAAIGVAAALFTWRRRRAREEAWTETAYTTEPAHTEPVYTEPVVHTPQSVAPPTPAAAAMVPAAVLASRDAADLPAATIEEASVTRADADDVEALTAAAPVDDRPWLELAMRPVRAGTTDADARVEIELTVGNAGPVDADDVRISAFMLADADDGEIGRMLVDPPASNAVEPLRIAAGEGARVDAALTLPRASLRSEARFRPVVIAEARYRLPGGGEGRTAASFDVGMTGDPDAPLSPVTTAGTEMRDDVEARLHRAAEHA